MIIQIDIDEVPVRIGKKGLEMTEDETISCGMVNFSVDVKIEPDGEWDITKVFPAIGYEKVDDGVRIKLVNLRGDEVIGQVGNDVARFLEQFAEEQINEDVHDTIMQADRSEFPKAEVS